MKTSWIFFGKNKIRKFGQLLFWLLLPLIHARANDSLTLAQSYINLSLTTTYFDSLPSERVAKILPFVHSQIGSIQNRRFLRENQTLANLTYAHYHFLKAKYDFENRDGIKRSTLLTWKVDMDRALNHLKGLRSSGIPSWKDNSYFEIIGVTSENYDTLNQKAEQLKADLNKEFNKDIYPDIKSIFYQAKNEDKYFFDSLIYYTQMYDMSLNLSVLRNSDYPIERLSRSGLSRRDSYNYRLASSIDLISRFLQLSYIADQSERVKSRNQLHLDLENLSREVEQIARGVDWGLSSTYPNYVPVDDFIRRELTPSAMTRLKRKIFSKFPHKPIDETPPDHSIIFSRKPDDISEEKAYFPEKAPHPSAKMSIQNFIPDSVKMKQVDNYIRKNFEEAGYSGRLHYFFLHEPGFAVTTGIERIENDGSPKTPESRWNLTPEKDEKFSLYEIFKTIFFATESDFRIIACIVSENEARTGDSPGSFGDFSDLIKRSYSSLPEELEEVELPRKTLTILVYHFYQSDIGQVPLLDDSERHTVLTHLEKTPTLENLTGFMP